MTQIFLSYRRKDSAAITGRIFDRLVGHFGRQAVIMDIDNIPYGKDFRAHVAQTLQDCDVILAVIGPQWAGLASDGKERIDRPTDWVRIELEAGLRRKIPIVPLLVEEAVMPQPERLPESLHDFGYYHAAEIDSGVDFHVHMDRLIRHVEQLLGEARQAKVAASDLSAPSADGGVAAVAGTPAVVPVIEKQIDFAPQPSTSSSTAQALPVTAVSNTSSVAIGAREAQAGTSRRRYRILAVAAGLVVVVAAALAWLFSGDSEAEISKYFEDGRFLGDTKEIRIADNLAWSANTNEFRNNTYCYVRYRKKEDTRYTDISLATRKNIYHVWVSVIGKVDSDKPINFTIDGSPVDLEMRYVAWSFAVDPNDTADLIEAMKAGKQLELEFFDRSGKRLVETYALPGLVGALATATRECPEQ